MNTNVKCDDASIAVAIVHTTPAGHNLYLLSEVLGMGMGEYDTHAGIRDAESTTILNSDEGSAWVHQRRGSEVVLIHITRAPADGLGPFAVSTRDVSPDPLTAFGEMDLDPDLYEVVVPGELQPWEDPGLMPVYHVQLETRDLIVSYEVATPEYDAVEVATMDLRARLVDPDVHIWCGSSSTIGYHPIGDGKPVVVSCSVATGCDPTGKFRE